METLRDSEIFSQAELVCAGSDESRGTTLRVRDETFVVRTVADALAARPCLAIFCAGSAVSLQQAPVFAQAGVRVVDNSSAWRRDGTKKLIVPEVNAHELQENDYIIANPNCSTIQLVVVLAPLHRRYKARRVVVSTYQAVSGSGAKGIRQLNRERAGDAYEACPDPAYPCAIDANVIPQIGTVLPNGNTEEEDKMIFETKKILSDPTVCVSATAVRVPVFHGHSESVNVSFTHPCDVSALRSVLRQSPGVIVGDDEQQHAFVTPKVAQGSNAVFVSRLRGDDSEQNTVNMWIVSDNLRKGAAVNAVQIGEYIDQKGWLGAKG